MSDTLTAAALLLLGVAAAIVTLAVLAVSALGLLYLAGVIPTAG
jgi:hypothetical protein